MDFRKHSFHLAAIVVLLAVSAFFFAPNAFQGKVLPQPDNDKAIGMQTEIQEFLKKEGKAPLWTNSAFGGMPGYQIYSPTPGNLTKPVYEALFLWTDYTSVWIQVFLAMLLTYICLIILQVDWRVALFGAMTYGISTYNVDILEAGHSTKMAALALAPGVFAGLALLMRRRWLLGGSLTALFIAVQVYSNHVQITYYTLLLSGFYFLAQLFSAYRERAMMDWVKAAGVAALAVALGFGANTSKLWPTYEYSQETIRGKSELTQKASKGTGLDKDYLFGWSYGIGESLTLLVPHFAGGGAGERFEDTKLYKNVQPQLRGQISSLFYNGDQPFVGTAIYFGAALVFLFFVGAFLLNNALRWWLLGGSLFLISLAWGKNFFLNDIWYTTLPFFNKFRAVSMALGPAHWCVAVLAALGLQKLMDQSIATDKRRRAVLVAGGLSALLCLIAMALGSSSGPNDQMLAQQSPELFRLLEEDRASMLRSDALRSLGFIAVALGLVLLYLRGTVKAAVMVPAIALVALVDTWTVCTRTIGDDKYVSAREAAAPPAMQPFDQGIKSDPDLFFRVLDLSRGGITGNAITSYFHKSLSGYHAAKIQRFQEVVDTFLTTNLADNLHIVGMLNGKYLVSQQGEPMVNPEVCGNAWFVKHVSVVPDGNAEMGALHTLNPKDSAVIQQSFAEAAGNLNVQWDSTATIRLTGYHPDKMTYEYSAASDQIAVFSEIYYPPSKGWKCYLNSQPAPDFFKVNYLLRGMRLPAGQNMKLEMRFEPRSYYLGEKISMAASGVLLLALLLGFFFWFRKKEDLPDPVLLSDVPVTGAKASGEKEKRQAPSTKKGKK
jgi:hypothetical protein